jgi:hypothetical protein
MLKTASVIAILTGLFAACSAYAQTVAAPTAVPAELPDQAKITLNWDVRIPLRDSVELSAAIYLPKGENKPNYCVFNLTPYVAQSQHDTGVYFAAHGIPFAIVDIRGRGNSGGSFTPFVHEKEDGYDIVEWLAKQPFCNGKVSMWGGSYEGYDQWATARDHPPHLATIVPAAAPVIGHSSPNRNNIFDSTTNFASVPLLIDGKTSQDHIANDGDFWAYLRRDRFVNGDSFASIDSIFSHHFGIPETWIAHPEIDDYWKSFVPTQADYAGMNFPVLQITGSYDLSQAGAVEYYRNFQKYAPPSAVERNYLVIGPWDHAGTRVPRMEVGGVKFGPAAIVDLGRLHLDWYAWTMGNGLKPAFLKKHVAYYVMGADKWRYADTLDDITAEPRAYSLSSTTNANTLAAPGALTVAGRACCAADQYVYDPKDVSTADLQARLVHGHTDHGSNVDTQLIEATDGKHLVYETQPFTTPTEVSGFFRLSAWIAIDQPDTDFGVEIYEIAPSGESILLTNDIKRARYRNGLDHAELVHTRKPLHYDFNSFLFTARLFPAGSRIRMMFGPRNSIYVEKNYNSGGVVALETFKDARTVSVKLFHDAAHPSTLYVPVAQPGNG